METAVPVQQEDFADGWIMALRLEAHWVLNKNFCF
jgi:hypothetical protein